MTSLISGLLIPISYILVAIKIIQWKLSLSETKKALAMRFLSQSDIIK